METPYFTIVAPDYEGSISAHRRLCFLESVVSQSYQDWELLLIHDGPRSSSPPLIDSRIVSIETDQRMNDWGHSSRDLGIYRARGKFIWIINADNIIYNNALAILHAYTLHKPELFKLKRADGFVVTHKENPEVLFFGVKMMGVKHIFFQGHHHRYRGNELDFQMVLPGWPPVKYKVDAMSAVIRSEIWRRKGWYLRYEESDGDLLHEIAREFGYKIIPEVLGEHW